MLSKASKMSGKIQHQNNKFLIKSPYIKTNIDGDSLIQQSLSWSPSDTGEPCDTNVSESIYLIIKAKIYHSARQRRETNTEWKF